MVTANHAARWLPRDFVEASQTGGIYTVAAYFFMLVVFLCEISSFLSPGHSTVMALDKSGSDALQINFDVDVHDIECRNLQLVVYAQSGNERIGTWGEDFWLRSIDAKGKSFGVAMKPQDVAEEEEKKRSATPSQHEKEMSEVRKQDGEKEIDSDWASSHDGFHHTSFDHVLQGHDFTFINFFAGWCSHCQRFAPEWDKIAQKVHGNGDDVPAMQFPDRDSTQRKVRMIKLNCVDFRDTCMQKGIDAYPTLRLYKADGTFSVYDGQRGEIEIVRWLERMIKTKSYGWGSNHEEFERGCNAKGRIQVPRVPGHLELMAGGGDQNLNPMMTNVSHSIKHLSFSDPDDGRYHRKSWSHLPGDVKKNLSPLDGKSFSTRNFGEAYIHDLKVVSTVSFAGQTAYQFLYQGRVSKLPDGQIPQAQIHYDIEPFSIYMKRDEKRWYDFMTSLLAILGGSFVVMRLMSRFSLHTWAKLKHLHPGMKAVARGGGLTVGHLD
eukprot:TRINITY_DN511_c0_g1_i2.p1 TRINITY_DN511_c0_g1~~TRINITY_DN511_c0_g1_i2.p1  ORF type:complete len:492 (-),score=76.06 TRINITY_DN511_c0_g1_i2:75-1550(-)